MKINVITRTKDTPRRNNIPQETPGKEEKHPDDEEAAEDIPYEEVMPEDASPRKNVPEEEPLKDSPSGKVALE